MKLTFIASSVLAFSLLPVSAVAQETPPDQGRTVVPTDCATDRPTCGPRTFIQPDSMVLDLLAPVPAGNWITEVTVGPNPQLREQKVIARFWDGWWFGADPNGLPNAPVLAPASGIVDDFSPGDANNSDACVSMLLDDRYIPNQREFRLQLCGLVNIPGPGDAAFRRELVGRHVERGTFLGSGQREIEMLGRMIAGHPIHDNRCLPDVGCLVVGPDVKTTTTLILLEGIPMVASGPLPHALPIVSTNALVLDDVPPCDDC